MIVTCPSCSTSYNVPPVEIGIEGRRVKCKKCHHVWFHDGERKVLDDLISRIQASDIEVDNIVFDDLKKPQKNLKKKISLFKKIKDSLHRITKKLSFSDGKTPLLNQFAGFMMGLALFSCLCFILVSQRWSIVRFAPSMAETYISAGFPLFAYANVNPEEMLIIEKANIQTVQDKKVIQGNLINLSSGYVRVPKIKITYLDSNNSSVLEGQQSLPISMIKKEFSYGFSLPVPDNMPDTSKIIRLNFVD